MLVACTLDTIEEKGTLLCGRPPPNPYPLSNPGENIRHIPVVGQPAKHVAGIPQKCQDHLKRGKS